MCIRDSNYRSSRIRGVLFSCRRCVFIWRWWCCCCCWFAMQYLLSLMTLLLSFFFICYFLFWFAVVVFAFCLCSGNRAQWRSFCWRWLNWSRRSSGTGESSRHTDDACHYCCSFQPRQVELSRIESNGIESNGIGPRTGQEALPIEATRTQDILFWFVCFNCVRNTQIKTKCLCLLYTSPSPRD